MSQEKTSNIQDYQLKALRASLFLCKKPVFIAIKKKRISHIRVQFITKENDLVTSPLNILKRTSRWPVGTCKLLSKYLLLVAGSVCRYCKDIVYAIIFPTNGHLSLSEQRYQWRPQAKKSHSYYMWHYSRQPINSHIFEATDKQGDLKHKSFSHPVQFWKSKTWSRGFHLKSQLYFIICPYRGFNCIISKCSYIARC